MALQEVVRHAKINGIRYLVGVWQPSGRNSIVSDLYAKLGFSFDKSSADGSTRWIFDTDHQVETPTMMVFRNGRLV
jgi:predicted enzyme involved in methoxymalonyl-ACP biosynthesis